MRLRPFLLQLLVSLLAINLAGAAEKGAPEKAKSSDFSTYPFWKEKKRGDVPQFVPGLTAVLQLTDAQKQQLAAARGEMENDEASKAARGSSKNDPSITAEQRDKARAALEAATARWREKVAAVLTTEQKALVEKINAAYAAAVADTGVVYADKFASVKADEAARKRIQEEKGQDIEEQFLHKLDALLSPAQQASMKAAAEAEEQRNAKAATVKKPAK
ncbi:MAG TPA: hypothetical protein VGO11_21605 [Chthoniobacteraceae bacterium]|jgi:hypothetical protein|nr:hypothetical protein [Chthoniobacteraceae bacterium]